VALSRFGLQRFVMIRKTGLSTSIWVVNPAIVATTRLAGTIHADGDPAANRAVHYTKIDGTKFDPRQHN